MRTFKTIMLPAHGGFDPESAKAWLQDGFRNAFAALSHGYCAEDKETRADFEEVAGDLLSLHEAAVHAIVTGKPVKVVVEEKPGGLDYSDYTAALVRVVARRLTLDLFGGDFEDGFEWFADVLRERLGKATA